MNIKKLGYIKFRIVLFVIITVLLGASLFFSKPIERALGLLGDGKITSEEFDREGSTDVDVVRTGEAVLHFIDVGQGDATLIEVPAETEATDDGGKIPGTFILIDGGSDDNKTHAAKNENGNLKIMDYLDSTVGTIEDFVFDYVILSHQHEDHCGGLNDVLNKYPSKIVYRPNSKSSHKNGDPLIANYEKMSASEKLWGAGENEKATSSKTYNDFLQSAYKTRFLTGAAQITREVRVTDANNLSNNIYGNIFYDNGNKTATDSDDLGKYFELYFHTPKLAVYTDPNDYSPVITFDYAGKRTIITGDAGKVAEDEFVKQYEGIDFGLADIFRIGHHGSKTSTSQKFINKISTLESRPETFVVISAGINNEYGHPTPEVLQRLTGSGFKEDNILRTDTNGDIVISVKLDADSNRYIMMFGAAMLRSYKDYVPAIPVKWWHIVITIWVVSLIIIFTVHTVRGKIRYGTEYIPSGKDDSVKNKTTGSKSRGNSGKSNAKSATKSQSKKKSTGADNFISEILKGKSKKK